MNKKKVLKSGIKRKFPAVEINDTLRHAIKEMAEANASALVVKDGEELVGIVTVTDIMYSISHDQDPQDTRVASFMTRCEFICDERANKYPCCLQLDEDEDVVSAIKVMYEGGVNHLLVSGSKGEPNLTLIKLRSESMSSSGTDNNDRLRAVG
jgi:CBS domain-containing protein